MRRAFIAVAWIAGTTVPLLVAIVAHFGCCALPFHKMAHQLMPLCHVAMNAMTGDESRDPATPPSKQEPVKRITGVAPSMTRLTSIAVHRANPISTPAAHRSFISLGAIRCDRDVGLHVLVETFRI